MTKGKAKAVATAVITFIVLMIAELFVFGTAYLICGFFAVGLVAIVVLLWYTIYMTLVS